MATPYVVQKVSQGYRHSELEADVDCNPAKCRFAYASWCPVCEVRQSSKCSRRRSKSEGVEADPLREHNRAYETVSQNQPWKRKIVKEYDVRNFAYQQPPYSISGHVNTEVLYGPEDTLYHQSMDVDGNMEHNRLPSKLLSPVKKFKERLLPSTFRYHTKSYEHGTVNVASNISLSHTSENPKHYMGSCGSGCSDVSPGRSRNSISPMYRKLAPLNGERIRMTSSSGSHSWMDCEGDNHRSDVQERYLHEVEILRSKLRELRGGVEGKRLRQRSESEPGAGYGGGGTAHDSSWEPKRARDISPNLPHDVPALAPSRNSLLEPVHKGPSHRVHDAKFPVVSPKIKTVALRKVLPVSQDDEASVSSESDFADDDQTCGSGEDGDSKGEPGEDSEEDDQSVMSSLTTVSSDSNTPSVVGETLGSISLNDSAKGDSPSIKDVSVQRSAVKEKPFPNALRTSLFSHVPPYIRFSLHDVKGEPLPFEIARHMKWKLSTITPLVVRRTLINSGWKLVRSEFSRESNDWSGTWGKHMKSLCFKTLKEFQKINHFPGTFQIGRKDRLWKNLYRLMTKFGKKEFGFIPRTYVLPQDNKLLRQAWEKSCGKEKWIIKPPASARGAGIKVIHRWAQIPKKRPLVVQKYIAEPYLINGSKFDLRLYVLVTSMNPLRLYIYDDGLVRFASVKYSGDMASLSDRYMHLTNYSINKMSSQYTQNEDASACQGHKWTVKTLWSYLEKDGVDVKTLWDNLVDLVIKTIISGESSINQLTRANLMSRYCSYELFGIDVLLDEALKPWLLEVNISPSLHSSSPLDLAVKGPMVRDLMNIAGYQIPNKLLGSQQEELLGSYGLTDKLTSLVFDKRLYTTVLSREERTKHSIHQQNSSREEYLEDILRNLTPDDVRHLIQSEDELSQTGRFVRIFPTPNTHLYHEFFEAPRYYNMMFDAWETKYSKNRHEGIHLLESLCLQKLHLTVPIPAAGPKKRDREKAKVTAADCDSRLAASCQAISVAINLQDDDIITPRNDMYSASQQSFLGTDSNSPTREEKSDEKPPLERKVLSLSSVALYRAARPRSGKMGVVLKPFPRSAYMTRKPKSSSIVTRTSTAASITDGCHSDSCLRADGEGKSVNSSSSAHSPPPHQAAC